MLLIDDFVNASLPIMRIFEFSRNLTDLIPYKNLNASSEISVIMNSWPF